jgi:hypothetical protein
MSAMSNNTNERMNAECADFGADFEALHQAAELVGPAVRRSHEIQCGPREMDLGEYQAYLAFEAQLKRDVLSRPDGYDGASNEGERL